MNIFTTKWVLYKGLQKKTIITNDIVVVKYSHIVHDIIV